MTWTLADTVVALILVALLTVAATCLVVGARGDAPYHPYHRGRTSCPVPG